MRKKIRRIGIFALTAVLSFLAVACAASNKNGAYDAGVTGSGGTASSAGTDQTAGGKESTAGVDEESGGAASGAGEIADGNLPGGEGTISETSSGTAEKTGNASEQREEKETEQTITIKADPAGAVRSASLRTSGDDMEEELDATQLKDLPFAVSVKYFLDDQPVTADEIAGKTGHVRIRFDYENRTNVKEKIDDREVQTIVPLAFLTAVMLPEDRFSDVTVTNGDVSGIQDNQVAIGYAMPGLEDALALDAVEDALDGISFEYDKDDKDKDKDKGKDKKSGKSTDAGQHKAKAVTEDEPVNEIKEESSAGTEQEENKEKEEDGIPTYVEIDAYAENFKLDFTATIVTNGLLSETKESTIDDLKDTVSDLQEIADAGDELQDGTEELRDGAGKFRDGLSQYVGGAGSLASGASQLNEGVKKLDENSASLTEGASQLADALAELNKGLTQTAEGVTEGQQNGESGLDVEAMASHAAEQAAKAAMEALSSNEELSDEEKAAAAQAAGTAAAMAAGADLQTAAGSMSSSGAGQLGELKNGIARLAEGASSLQQGVKAYTEGVSKLAEGSKQLSDGAGKLSSSGAALLSGYDKMRDGIKELADGIKDMNQDGMQKSGDTAGHEMTDTLNQFRALILADRGHTALGTYDGTEGAVRYIVETDEVS